MKETHTRIQAWYAIHGRSDLPWRNTDNPYHIYLSEIMLQQTQVKTVLERYYFPFLRRFPTLKILGESSLDDVLKQWEGLGYYTRARNLHKTATSIEKLPETIEELISLPGIGKNTAHAIATFAFKQPLPIMEANVKRILCRVHKLQHANDKQLWALAYQMVDREEPFNHNQAMMDIGATLCLPKNPHCEICPLKKICKGQEEPEIYPEKKRRRVPTRTEHIVLSLYNNTLSLSQRSGKFLHGLWGFDSIETPPCSAEAIGEVTHAYTHFKLRCTVWVQRESTPEKNHYFTPEEIGKLAISKVDEKILKLYLGTIE